MDTEYIELFSLIESTLDKQRKQKLRGLNDFNLLTTVLNYHDEVRLHSRMIGNLLNPHAKHYQGTLFLEIFLEKLGLTRWGMDLNNTNVYIEYNDIDLYITDGSKHLIIENKIWAGDQPCQIMKYINIIVEESNNPMLVVGEKIYGTSKSQTLDENLLRVVYLTPVEKNVPSEHKEDNGYIYFSGEDTRLDDCSKQPNTKLFVPNGLKRYMVKYHKIGYKDEILSWLYACKKEVRNISNLNESIKQYIDVVKMVNRNYKGNVVTIEKELLAKSENDNFVYKDELMTALKLDSEMKHIKKSILIQFFEQVVQVLEGEGYRDITADITPKKRIYTNNCSNFFDRRANVIGVFIDCDFENDLYLYVSMLYSGLYYGLAKCVNGTVVNMDENNQLDNQFDDKSLRYTDWNEIKWYASTDEKLDMMNLSNEKVWNLLTNFENSKAKTNILEIITEAKT